MLDLSAFLPTALVHIFYTGVLVAFAALVGQSLYEYARQYDHQVEEKIKNREHPDIRYVLYDIFWVPATLLAVLVIIRIGAAVILPKGRITGMLTTSVDVLLVVTLLWFAVRTVKEVFELSDKSALEGSSEA